VKSWHRSLAELSFTKTTVGNAEDVSRQQYMPSAQIARTTSVVLVVTAFADTQDTQDTMTE